MRRTVVLAGALAAALVAGGAGAAAADDTVVVPGLSFPAGSTYVTSFGCPDLYGPAATPPLVRIGNVDASPAGRRSAGVLPRVAGAATGPVSRVDSVAATTVAGFSARADRGASGAAWVWYVAPGLSPGQVWVGRAALAAGPGWSYVDTADASYTWTLTDALTGQRVAGGGTSTVAAFTEEHGDGPGYLLAGLGCDGAAFSVDALQVGSPGAVTTYDLEGLVLRTTISASAGRVPAGEPVTLTGATLDTAGVPTGSTLVLEARPAGQKAFAPLGAPATTDGDGLVRLEVSPEVTTQYRWYAPATGYADATRSGVVTVSVGAPVR